MKSIATRWTCKFHHDLGKAFEAFGFTGYEIDEMPGWVWTSPCQGTGSVPMFLYAVQLETGAISVPLPGDDEVVVGTFEAAEELIARLAFDEMGEVL